MTNDLVPSIREEKIGFTLQTLIYSNTFELQKLGSRDKERLERAVAIMIDDNNRIKRCRFNSGYIHERWETGGWKTVGVYSTLEELKTSQIYIDYRQNQPEAVTEEEEEQ